MALPDLIGESAPERDFVARRHALGGEDVAALAVGVLDQRDVAGAVRIVLDALDHALDAVLVATEVDDAVLAAYCPLPWWRVVMRPTLLRPEWRVLLLGQRLVRAALPQVRLVELDDGSACPAKSVSS